MTMKPTAFPEQTCVYAKGQIEYMPLPVHRNEDDPNGVLTCCWRLSWRERIKVLFTGRVWNEIMTFRKPLQPHLLSIDKPGQLYEPIFPDEL